MEGLRIKESKMGATLPDARLYARLERLVEQLSQAPMSGIPQACGSVHESKAAYRFLG
jgi:Transposase DNA-binding